jgi:hypothetical protein
MGSPPAAGGCPGFDGGCGGFDGCGWEGFGGCSCGFDGSCPGGLVVCNGAEITRKGDTTSAAPNAAAQAKPRFLRVI